MPHLEEESLLRPENYSRRRLYIPVALVLFLVFLERVSFYSLTSNLFLFLSQDKWATYNSMIALFLFTGVAYMSCFIGGIIADTVLGRYATIFVGFVLLTGVYWVLPFLSLNDHSIPCTVPFFNLNSTIPMYDEPCGAPILSVLVFAAIGCGIVRANIVPFGAEQSRCIGPDHLRVYSNYFYWCVNLGGLVAILAIAYVQQTYGFYYGYMAPAICISFATLLLLSTCNMYTSNPHTKGIFSTIFDVFKEAYKSNKRFKARLAQNPELSRTNTNNMPSWLDMAKVTYGGKFREALVEDVKSLRTITIVFIFLVPYWVLYFQMQSSFLDQGLHMRLGFSHGNSACNSSCNKEDKSFYIPAAWLTLFDVIGLLIFIPLMDRVIYPFLDYRGLKIPLLCRMMIGMFFATLSMLTAGVLEYFRYKLAETCTICQVIEKMEFVAADLSIFWQIPQYLLIGFSEIFAVVGGMEFACSQAPTSMQGVVMGLFYLFTGIGSFLGSLILFAFEYTDYSLRWSIVDINSGKLSNYFFVLSGLQFVTLIVFFFVSMRLKVRKISVFSEPTMSRVFLNGFQSESYDSIEQT